MRIAILTETYTKNMGYLGTVLPRYLASLGADVHVIALTLPPYYQLKDSRKPMPVSRKARTLFRHGRSYEGYTFIFPPIERSWAI
jgi:hypothetical protein